MATYFDTTPYFTSHMKAPRGEGRWAFALTRNPKMEDVWFSPVMTYGEAKKLAAKEFSNPVSLYVLP